MGTTSAPSSSGCPDLYFARDREVFERDGMLYEANELCLPRNGEATFSPARRHYRTMGDANLTAAVRSEADTIDTDTSPLSPLPGSLSAVRPGETTVSAKRQWKNRKREGYF